MRKTLIALAVAFSMLSAAGPVFATGEGNDPGSGNNQGNGPPDNRPPDNRPPDNRPPPKPGPGPDGGGTQTTDVNIGIGVNTSSTANAAASANSSSNALATGGNATATGGTSTATGGNATGGNVTLQSGAVQGGAGGMSHSTSSVGNVSSSSGPSTSSVGNVSSSSGPSSSSASTGASTSTVSGSGNSTVGNLSTGASTSSVGSLSTGAATATNSGVNASGNSNTVNVGGDTYTSSVTYPRQNPGAVATSPPAAACAGPGTSVALSTPIFSFAINTASERERCNAILEAQSCIAQAVFIRNSTGICKAVAQPLAGCFANMPPVKDAAKMLGQSELDFARAMAGEIVGECDNSLALAKQRAEAAITARNNLLAQRDKENSELKSRIAALEAKAVPVQAQPAPVATPLPAKKHVAKKAKAPVKCVDERKALDACLNKK